MKNTRKGSQAPKEEEFRDLGFGTKAVENNRRLLNVDGSFNVKRKGLSFFRSWDIYHTLITMSWTRFVLMVFVSYLVVNFIFAMLYMAVGLEHLAGVLGESVFARFLDSFFFSAQTLTTVGYGRISPVGASASTVAALESMIGLLGFALATGLLYGRFSRPQAKILYSEIGIIAPYRGGRGFMFRIANLRSTQIIELEAGITLSMLKPDRKSRTFDNIKLERHRVNFLSLNWTIVHPIDEDSPLYGMSEEEFNRSDAEFIVLIKGFDDTFSQTVYSRSSYKFHEIKWSVKFSSMVDGEEGMSVLHLDKISDVEPAELPAWKERHSEK